jgi:hypothetical protein
MALATSSHNHFGSLNFIQTGPLTQRKSPQMPSFPKEEPSIIDPRNSIQSRQFYIPPHPIAILTIPYGLLLTFSSWLYPQNIPSTAPLGDLAKYLGDNYNGLMAIIAVIAGLIHLADSVWAVYLANQHKLTSTVTFFWALNGLGFGIFGIWPLVFPDYFHQVQDQYCAVSPCKLRGLFGKKRRDLHEDFTKTLFITQQTLLQEK